MDPAELVNVVMPYVTAAIGAYGARVLDRIRDGVGDAGADGAVDMGRQVLQRLLGGQEPVQALESTVADLADDPEDDDFRIAVQAQIKKILRRDEYLRRDLIALLADAGVSADASPGVVTRDINAYAPGGVVGGNFTGPVSVTNPSVPGSQMP